MIFHWKDEARATMDSILVVYEGKDPKKNAERLKKKAESIEWYLSEIEKGF